MALPRQIKIMLLFTLAGPPIAAIPFALILTTESIGLGILAFVLSYPIGVIPSVIACVLFIMISRWMLNKRWVLSKQRTFILGAFCGAIGVLFLFILFNLIMYGGGSKTTYIDIFISLFLLGCITGGICGVVSLRFLDEMSPSITELKDITQ